MKDGSMLVLFRVTASDVVSLTVENVEDAGVTSVVVGNIVSVNGISKCLTLVTSIVELLVVVSVISEGREEDIAVELILVVAFVIFEGTEDLTVEPILVIVTVISKGTEEVCVEISKAGDEYEVVSKLSSDIEENVLVE